MRKFGNPLGGRIARTKGKGGGQAMLPNRAAVHRLIGGSPDQQTLSNYAKLTPSGASAMAQPYPAIMSEGEEGASVEPDV